MCDTWKYFGFHVRKKLSRVTIRINALNFCLPITVIIRYFKLSVARLIINHDEFVPGTMCTGHGLKLSSTSPLRHWHRRRSHRQSNCEPFAHVFFFPQLAFNFFNNAFAASLTVVNKLAIARKPWYACGWLMSGENVVLFILDG